MKKHAAVLSAFLLLAGWPAAGFAEGNRVDPRDSAVDRALGGMEEGSRPPAPEGSFQAEERKVPGSMLSPRTDTGVTAPAGAGTGTGGSAGAGPGNGPIGGAPAGGGSFESAAPSGFGGAGYGQGGAGSGGGTSGGAGGGGSEPAGTVDTEIPGGTDTGGGSSGGSILDVGADVSLEDGTVDANLDAGVNTEGSSLLELDAATDVAADAPVAAEVDSAESALIESELGIEEAINDAPVSGEAVAGIEADVDASAEPDEPIDNPADGLSL